MNVLGFNPSHHSSACIVKNGKLILFLQEERISREKYDSSPFLSLKKIAKNFKLDYGVWATPSLFYPLNSLEWMNNNYTPYFFEYIGKYYKHKSRPFEWYDLSPDSHHLSHASHAFYNSGFDKAISIVIDGVGSIIGNEGTREVESAYICSYPNIFKLIHKNTMIEGKENLQFGISRAYEIITMHLGFDRNEAGKTMGLSSYGKYNLNLPKIYDNINFFTYINLSKRQIKLREKEQLNPTDICVDEITNPILKPHIKPKKWHRNRLKIRDIEKDLAWKIQKDSQEKVAKLIKKNIDITGLKKVCCSGGYFLNCVTNYYLLKEFPDIEFYFEPVANDAGTAIGAAKLIYYSKTKDTTIRPLKSLYLGPKYSKKHLLKKIKKYVDK